MKDAPHNFIPTPSSPLEELKHGLLAALYQEDAGQAAARYAAILDYAGKPRLTETGEKYLRQIQAAVKTLAAPKQKPGFSQVQAPTFSALKPTYQTLQARLRNRARQHQPQYLAYPDWEQRASLLDWQAPLAFATAITFQLTSGCSNFCRRCNEWALPRVRAHFTRDAAATILEKLLAQGNDDLALYGGSDPLDWEDGDDSLQDLLAGAASQAGPKPRFSLLTKIPRGREKRLKLLLRSQIELGVSLTLRNQQRIQAIEKDLGLPLTKQHATPDLLIPACLDEDFTSVKPSITDSYGTEIAPDGAFIIIPTFTSALYPFGHKKIPVTRKTLWFPVKRLGRPALLQDYFKPLQVVGKDRVPYHLDLLLDVQVENMLLDNGDYDLTPPGMRSVLEYFDIFNDKARRKRRAMTLSVVRRLKSEDLGKRSYSRLSDAEKNAYRSKIAAHLGFTQKAVVARARVSAAAFFLAAIRDYVRFNPVKTRIIAFLTRNEYQTLKTEAPAATAVPLSERFLALSEDVWPLFRILSLGYVHGQPAEELDAFLWAWPAAYDPAKDRFVRKLQDQCAG